MDRQLAALAAEHGVATWYEDSRRKRVAVRPETVINVLGLLDVDATTPARIGEALASARESARARRLPPTLVLRSGAGGPLPGSGVVTTEDGERIDVGLALPGDLPLGWHRLACGEQDVTLVVVPRRLPAAAPTWGWMLQLYALHSADSWGMGDLADLASLTRWAGGGGEADPDPANASTENTVGDGRAGLILLNPLHAVGPTHPVPASPYSPTSRRFANPLYLSVTETAAFRGADADLAGRVAALRPPAREATDLIDYDAVWSAKLAALELLFPLAGPIDLDADPDVTSFATYCALAERHGSDWRTWPPELRAAGSDSVLAARDELGDRIAFFVWLQRMCAEQLTTVATAAHETGMPVGIMHDLAVGVDPGGADGWMLGDVLATGARVGAPPDAFNQLGQDWGLAAWRPDRLAETGYAAYRDLLRRVLSHAGGLRVDHVAGLFRLWWIPPGAGATDGTYVHYDADAMLGILALEAERAGAVVIGEDLGTVQPAVSRALGSRNMLGSTVAWFARDWDRPGSPFLAPDQWPRNTLASISTHDLPTAYGFLTGVHVQARAELGLLTESVASERARADDDRRQLVKMLRANGFLLDTSERPGRRSPSEDDIVQAMHAALAASPARLIAASFYDVLGDLRQPNMPGTTDQYPNWRMPLPASLEEILIDDRIHSIARLLAGGRPRSGSRRPGHRGRGKTGAPGD
jgi:4-alpha-glucanotransferase